MKLRWAVGGKIFWFNENRNWEFEYYLNNRSNSYVRDSILYLKPTLTSDTIGLPNVLNGYTMDLWGSSPADLCTGFVEFV